MANIERLRDVVRWAEEQTKRSENFTFDMNEWVNWDWGVRSGDTGIQLYSKGEWKCNTSACLAGSAAIYGGQRVVSGESIITPEGEWVAIETWAQEYFDLTDEQADFIFYATEQDLQGIKSVINEALQEEVFSDVEWTHHELAVA